MATQSTRQSKNQAGSPASAAGSRSRSASAGTVRRRRSARRSSGGFLGGVLELIRLTYFGRVIFVLFIAALLVLLNILLSRNQFELFFRLLGIEMILTALITWLRFLLRKN